mgnify:CR=1 FL=1
MEELKIAIKNDLFWSYLWGIEIRLFAYDVCLAINSFDLTYEGLK